MTLFPWQELMAQWSNDILESKLAQEMDHFIPPEAHTTRWLGYPGATETQIAATEARLGAHFPPSYREFLMVSNGWTVLTQFAGLLWSTDEIAWLRARDPKLIAIWGEEDDDEPEVPDAVYFVYGKRQNAQALRRRYFQTALQMSNPRYLDGEFYLLNPQVVTPEGEWEAWFFANWLPGASRYRSFWELMQAEYEDFLALEQSR